MKKNEFFHEVQAMSIATASAELCEVIYDLMTEAAKQGVDLPPDFRVWASRMAAHRSKELLDKLAWRSYRAGVDNNNTPEDNKRPTLPPPV